MRSVAVATCTGPSEQMQLTPSGNDSRGHFRHIGSYEDSEREAIIGEFRGNS